MVMKLLIWTAVLLGIAPAILVAISTLFVSRLRRKNIDFGSASMLIGPLTTSLNTSSHCWAAVILLIGAAFVVIGLFFLLPRQSSFVWKGGFSKIESHIGQLLRSPGRVSSLIVATPDDESSILLIRENGQTTLHVSIQRIMHPGQESRVRELCKELSIVPVREFFSANGGVEEATINFEFAMSHNPTQIANLCIRVFNSVFGATDRRGLKFIANRSQ
jgi:hypothetical protein